jgi:hypothetical protein
MSVMTPRQPGAPAGHYGRPDWQDAMPHPAPPHSRSAVVERVTLAAAGVAALVQTLILLVAVVPTSIWAAHGYPEGPIPAHLYPVVAALFYALPTITGALCRRWPVSVVLATLPAWIDLAAFAVFASPKVGPFYVVLPDHAINSVGTLEFFAVMGALGWLGRTACLALLGRGEWSSR